MMIKTNRLITADTVRLAKKHLNRGSRHKHD